MFALFYCEYTIGFYFLFYTVSQIFEIGIIHQCDTNVSAVI